MALLSRKSGWLVLAVSSAFWLAAGCSSGTKKKMLEAPSDGGAAGADSKAEAGAPGGGAAGAAGEGEVSVGGEGGATASGGAAGALAGGGAAGAVSFSCVTSGSVTGVSLSTETIHQVCRGAAQTVDYGANAAEEAFTCCAVSDTETPYGVQLDAISDGDGQSSGRFLFIVPVDAPLGAHTLSVDCESGPVANPIALEVSEDPAPVILSISAQIFPTQNMVVKGQHLANVTYAGAVGSQGTNFECVVDANASTDTTLTCSFPNGISVGTNNTFVVYQENCGYAVDTPLFDVVPQIEAKK